MKPTLFARNDNDLRQGVLIELESDPKITSRDIAITANDGVVTLSGFVPTYREKSEVENAVKRVYGVRAVANDMQVQGAPRRSDPEIARDAVRALESHFGASAAQIMVTVENGWVNLQGPVEWQFQKSVAGSMVRNLKGVKGIMNNLEIKPRVSPAEVKSKIEGALQRSAERGACRVAAEVEGNIVTLYGTVSSWSERGDAERAAWSAPGTAVVENHITVIP